MSTDDICLAEAILMNTYNIMFLWTTAEVILMCTHNIGFYGEL